MLNQWQHSFKARTEIKFSRSIHFHTAASTFSHNQIPDKLSKIRWEPVRDCVIFPCMCKQNIASKFIGILERSSQRDKLDTTFAALREQVLRIERKKTVKTSK